MFRLFQRKPQMPETYHALIEELAAEGPQTGYFDVNASVVGQRLLAAGPEEQRGFVLAALEWLNHRDRIPGDHLAYKVRRIAGALLRRKLPLAHDDLIALLSWSIRQESNFGRSIPEIIKAVEGFLQEHLLTPVLREKIGQLVAAVESDYYNTTETRRWTGRLKELGELVDLSTPLADGEAWSDAAIADIKAMNDALTAAWLALLNACQKSSGSTPKAKWLKSVEPSLEKIGFPAFKQSVLKWFPLVDKPRTQPIESWNQWQPDPNQMIYPVNADILKALVWLCAGREDKEIARALMALAVSAYRKVPGVGPRCVRVGNACVYALGQMPGAEGTGQLALLKVRVKFGTAQKGIEKALAVAAARVGLSPEEIEEMSVPAYGLQEVGARREQLGELTAELSVKGTNAVKLQWLKPDGKPQTSVPQAIKEQHAEELKELKQAVKDIRQMLPAQAARLDNLYLEQKRWTLPVWRERYLDHPLVGTLARRLVWQFNDGARAAAGAWHDESIAGLDGNALDWLDDATQVELWHPISEPAETVLAWRDWLAEREIQQPFKQAHREIYVLTEAERQTRVYSNRFAAHVIKQHQFNALCAARGWKNKLRLMVDDEYPPATRTLPAWNLRAEFWIEGIGDNYGTDTTEAGTYLYLTTDQVRFYPIDAQQHFAHAGGGGYYLNRYGPGSTNEPLILDQVPPLVFSEIMRDVDLFVGVASVANDPNWADGGPEARHRDYWLSHSFGDLSETAKTRRAVLERLIPRLKIADRCSLTERFLRVRGDIRAYKIHLGSGNILMEPNDQYLCIVPARGTAGEGLTGKVFLPFEGDNTLAIILSKAFLLADDKQITDPTITRQIGM